MINQAFFRVIASIVVLALLNANIIDSHSQQTLTDILTIVFMGGGLLLFGIYEIVHLLHKGSVEDNQTALSRFVAFIREKAFATDPLPSEEIVE